MRTSEAPTSSTTRRNRSMSSIPACRVRVMPVSGAQQACVQEMLHAAVHSIYMRDGCRPASTDRTTGGSLFFSGSFNGQSPQNFDPPPFSSSRRDDTTGPLQTSRIEAARASPRTRLPYGSAQPQTRRPSQSMTSVVHGHVHWKRVATKSRDILGFFGQPLHVGLKLA